MAQHVGYFENNVRFEEGPFVVCDLAITAAYRIEAELVGHRCPVQVDSSVFRLLLRFGLCGNGRDRRLVDAVCDKLNELVRAGLITRPRRCWVATGDVDTAFSERDCSSDKLRAERLNNWARQRKQALPYPKEA